MDNWTAKQIVAMLAGGNGQFRGFLDRQKGMERSGPMLKQPMEVIYGTKAARYYREELGAFVGGIEEGEGGLGGFGRSGNKLNKDKKPKKRTPDPPPPSPPPLLPSSLPSSLSSSLPPPPPLYPKTFPVTFPTLTLGLSLSPHPHHQPTATLPTVTTVTQYTAAEAGGVLPGDVLLEVNGEVVGDCGEVTKLLGECGRPVVLVFGRKDEPEEGAVVRGCTSPKQASGGGAPPFDREEDARVKARDRAKVELEAFVAPGAKEEEEEKNVQEEGGMNGGGNGNNNSSMRGDELHSSTEMVVHSATLAMQAAAAAGEREQEIMKKEIIILKQNMKEMEVKVKETMDLQVVTESEKNELQLVGCF